MFHGFSCPQIHSDIYYILPSFNWYKSQKFSDSLRTPPPQKKNWNHFKVVRLMFGFCNLVHMLVLLRADGWVMRRKLGWKCKKAIAHHQDVTHHPSISGSNSVCLDVARAPIGWPLQPVLWYICPNHRLRQSLITVWLQTIQIQKLNDKAVNPAPYPADHLAPILYHRGFG